MHIIEKAGPYTIKHISGTSAQGNEYDFYSLEKRTFNKETQEWESKEISLSAGELATIAGLCQGAFEYASEQQAVGANARLQNAKNKKANAQEEAPF